MYSFSLRACGVGVLLVGTLAPSWLAAGDETPASSMLLEQFASKEEREFWSFRPLRQLIPSHVRYSELVKNPIDLFVLAKLEEAGLRPLLQADKATFIRRATFDLTGLPPSPAEIDAFSRDESPDACDKLVDRLLTTPAYGEHWAQYWLDLARFGETDGFELDAVRPNAWRYRDWIIDALNRDVSYDQFVRLQICGDELDPANPESSVATGFLLCGPDMPDLNRQKERRHIVLNEMAATVGSVFLGLQIGCAQCHDHKFDPISQADFYRLRAFFESAHLFTEHPIPTPEQLRKRAEAELEGGGAAKNLIAEIRKLDDQAADRLREMNPDLEPTLKNLRVNMSLTERTRRAALNAKLAKLKPLPELPLGRVMREKEVRPTFLMIRGDFDRPGPKLSPAYPRVLDQAETPVEPVTNSATSSGLRRALAEWITRPDHPLTSRVIVNRLWQAHFGEGLVRSPSDFGKMGEPPSHPELLDWLAAELPRRGWSLKEMHKLIMTSAAYRQASRPVTMRGRGAIISTASSISSSQFGEARNANDEWQNWRRLQELDPDNRLLGRFPRRRLTGEAIRDAMLAAADYLSQRRGGPGVRPPLPAELHGTLRKGQWTVSPEEEDHRRRSIYLHVCRNLRYPFFETFDRPESTVTCPQRKITTSPSQALALMNSEQSLVAARRLAGLLLTHSKSDARTQISQCYQRTLGRVPTEKEFTTGEEFLSRQALLIAAEGLPSRDMGLPMPTPAGVQPAAAAALTRFCLAIFNLNEFLYLD